MALNLRFSGQGGRTLPDFRGGSEFVQGLQNVGLRNRQEGHHVSYIDVNNFENNWEDLDEEFSRRDLESNELEPMPVTVDNVPVDSLKYQPGTSRRDQELSDYKTRGQGLISENQTGTSQNDNDLPYYNIRGQGVTSEYKTGTSKNDNDSPYYDIRGQGLTSDYPTRITKYSDGTSDREPTLASFSKEDQGLTETSFGDQKQFQIKTYRNDQGFNSIVVGNDRSDAGGDIGCCGYVLWFLSIILIILTFPFSLCMSIKVVQEYERAVIFRLGRLVSGGAKGPGLFFIIPCIDSYTKVDMRTVSFDVPPQEVLTKDSVTVAVDAVVYYRIQNATMSITNVEDSNRSTRLLAQTTLRNVLGTKNLSEILSDREHISHVMQSSLDEATDPWGVKVERVEVKDVRLPVQLQRAMAAEAEAAREARAKVIAAEGEQKASRALKEAADIMAESPAAIQLRYLQTLNTISAEKNSTIVFPLPIDLMHSFLKRGGEREQAHF